MGGGVDLQYSLYIQTLHPYMELSVVVQCALVRKPYSRFTIQRLDMVSKLV